MGKRGEYLRECRTLVRFIQLYPHFLGADRFALVEEVLKIGVDIEEDTVRVCDSFLSILRGNDELSSQCESYRMVCGGCVRRHLCSFASVVLLKGFSQFATSLTQCQYLFDKMLIYAYC